MGIEKKPTLALLLGEAAGIGPEVVAKALELSEVRDMAQWVIMGDERVFQQGLATAGVQIPYKKITTIEELNDSKDQIWFLDLMNLDPSLYRIGAISVNSGKATGETLKYALNLAKNRQLAGVVYAPLNKEALQRSGYQFKDEIHFFASLLEFDQDYGEINVMEDLWVARVTSHIPFKDVSQFITKENVIRTIHFANRMLTKAGVKSPKIVVAALNPHAGEGGLLGMEEIEGITPAILAAKSAGIDVEGPYPADTLFVRLKKQPFNCLVSMYHDQAQTGMKLLGFNKGVTISAGLPVVLTTPAHGTAFDIAGKGEADPGAMIQAMKMGVLLATTTTN